MSQKANVFGGSKDKARGCWCTPKWLAELIGSVDYDPCSNPRSHIQAETNLVLEKGDDGCPDGSGKNAGAYFDGETQYMTYADDDAIVFVNPPYGRGEVDRWINHWRQTRFIFLLKWSPDTKWFKKLLPQCDYVWFPNRRVNFEPPPGVDSSNNPLPHALYLRKPSDELLVRLRGAGYLLRVDASLLDSLGLSDQDAKHERKATPGSGRSGQRAKGTRGGRGKVSIPRRERKGCPFCGAAYDECTHCYECGETQPFDCLCH